MERYKILEWFVSPVKGIIKSTRVKLHISWCGVHDFELDCDDHLAPYQFETGFAKGMCLL